MPSLTEPWLRLEDRLSSPLWGSVAGVTDSLRLTIVYERGEDGWVLASVPEVPGTHTQGRTREEARENVIDALRLMLRPEPGEEPGDDSEPLELTITG